MSEVEEPQFTTLAERIAALNKQKSFNNTAPEPVRKRPPPPPPPGRAAAELRTQSLPVITATHAATPSKPFIPPRPKPTATASFSHDEGHAAARPSPGAPPALPSRTPSSQASPHLPPRRQPSSLLTRRNSGSSEISQHSAISSLSIAHSTSSATSQGSNGTYKLAPAYNPSALPPLPPTKRERDAKAAKEAAEAERSLKALQIRAAPDTHTKLEPQPVSKPTLPSRIPSGTIKAIEPAPTPAPAPRPSLPPRLPSRPVKARPTPEPQPTEPTQPPRKLPARIMGFGSSTNGQNDSKPPPLPGSRPSPSNRPHSNAEPPPIPVASRPSASQINAAVARAAAPPPVAQDCWICRDWSGPDGVAERFPRQSLPRNDVIGYLAHNLCSSFPSYTDKARAIFAWFHHNIDYDTYSFFNKCVKHMTAEDTIFTGKAVCAGYAETYMAIAKRAGLDCIMVCGHGKGYGHTPLKEGERPPPPDATGHAWNAVRIDGGDWKLLDACWGAGHLGDDNQYKKVFDPRHFIESNDNFGLSHFPENPQHQFRDDGRTQSWEEYFIGPLQGEPPTWYGEDNREGLDKRSLGPKQKHIAVNSGQVVRFQFSKVCEHWTYEKHGEGKPPLLLLSIHGADGRKEDMVPFETDGFWHWADVHARDLGAPGQAVQVAQITTIGGQDARGKPASEYFAKKGRVAMSWSYVMRWELV